MSFPRYTKYKDSGIEWLGDLPEHWEVSRVANLFREVAEVGCDDLPILSVSIHDGVSDKELADEEMDRKVTRSDDRSKYKRVKPGDLVYNMMRAWQGGFGTVTVDGMVSPAYVVARPRTQIESSYVEYLLRTPNAVEQMRRHSRGVTDFRLRLYWDEFKNIGMPVPPPSEQIDISTFLDHETAKIDELVAEQRRLMELLKEKRQAIISHAVTKGLNPNAPMKPSGVEWLGDVPAHWEVKYIRHFATVLRGKFTHRPRNDPAFYDGDFPFVQTGDITGSSRYITGFKQTLNERGIAVSKEFPRGTLVMAIAANIGDVAILDFPAYFPDSIVGLVPKSDLNLMFLYYLMIAMKQPMLMSATVSTQMNLNVDQICSLSAACPPSDEQARIVSHLDQVVQEMETLTANAELAINLLQERRSALIAAAVTGQIDVRAIARRQAA